MPTITVFKKYGLNIFKNVWQWHDDCLACGVFCKTIVAVDTVFEYGNDQFEELTLYILLSFFIYAYGCYQCCQSLTSFPQWFSENHENHTGARKSPL